jgi:hypothetical protein
LKPTCLVVGVLFCAVASSLGADRKVSFSVHELLEATNDRNKVAALPVESVPVIIAELHKNRDLVEDHAVIMDLLGLLAYKTVQFDKVLTPALKSAAIDTLAMQCDLADDTDIPSIFGVIQQIRDPRLSIVAQKRSQSNNPNVRKAATRYLFAAQSTPSAPGPTENVVHAAEMKDGPGTPGKPPSPQGNGVVRSMPVPAILGKQPPASNSTVEVIVGLAAVALFFGVLYSYKKRRR